MMKHFFLALSSGFVLADQRDDARCDLISDVIDEHKIGPGDHECEWELQLKVITAIDFSAMVSVWL